MKTIHYTNGYGGKYNYLTKCGKEIHSHSEVETATVNPALVTCEHCLATAEWKDDNNHATETVTDYKRRIYIESDILHADELENSQQDVIYLCEEKGVGYTNRVFNEVLDFAWHDLAKTWEAVKKADEIYTSSSLLPLCGNSYMGAPVIFNGMCERAINEGVTGKDVYILNSLKYVHWDMIDIPLMQKAFEHNNLYMFDDKMNMVKIDVTKIKK